MIEHTVILTEMGGADVITCETLGIQNLIHEGKIEPAEIKNTILRQLVIDKKDPRATFKLIINDIRPEPQNFNDLKTQESKNYKPKRRF